MRYCVGRPVQIEQGRSQVVVCGRLSGLQPSGMGKVTDRVFRTPQPREHQTQAGVRLGMVGL